MNLLDKVAKILNHAENASTEAEANAFLAKAQSLATEHSIDLARARQHTQSKQRRESPVQEHVTIGEPGRMGNTRLVNLYTGIADANDVKCNIAHNSSYVVAFGFPSDIEVVNTLFLHLSHQMVEAGNAFVRAGEWRGRTEYDPSRYRDVPVTARRARLGFYDGFISRVTARLMGARRQAREALIDADLTALAPDTARDQTGTALVLAAKEVEVVDFYKNISTARGSWRGNRRAVAGSSLGRSRGVEAGDNARLTSTPTLPETRKALT